MKQNIAISMISLDAQLNWALKHTFSDLNINFLENYGKKSFIGAEKRIELKCVNYLYQYLVKTGKLLQMH